MTDSQIDADRTAAGWRRCPRCAGAGRITARTDLLESTNDCVKCEGIGWLMPATIFLTDAEREHVEWAFGAMHDYWGAECKPGETPDASAEGVTENDLTVPDYARMPFLNGGALTLSTWDEVNDDLRYRVEEMLPDMADNAIGNADMSRQRAQGVARSCASFAAKLRGAMELTPGN